MKRYDCRTNLIVCQKSKVRDWTVHMMENYEYVAVFDLTDKKQFSGFMNWITAPQDAPASTVCCVGVINYELAWRRSSLLKLTDFTLMLDESSLIQNPKAKQTKFVLKLRPAHTILLSGSPVGGKYENLWSQCNLLGWKITQRVFDVSYVNWTLIEAGGIKHKIVDKSDPYKNVDRLKRKMREHGAVFLKTEEVLDLPDQVFQQIRIPTSKEYWKFQRNRIVEIEGDELVGDTSLTRLLYSRQLCGQYNQSKLEAFRDLIQSTKDRMIVFYNFNDELDALKRICRSENRPTSEINGHRKDLKAYETESDSITLVQYQSGSMGLNLQLSNRIVFFTLPLSSEHFEQSKKRIHRIGQQKTCFYYLMICEGSVEEQILETLEQRKDFTDELFK
jgi:SNF2 family DNA or RNA helicase